MNDVCHLLIVEDNSAIRDLLVAVLDEGGYRFESVSNVDEALSAIAKRRPNLVIADVRSPGGGDGLSIAAYARARKVPTILLTGDHTLEPTLASAATAYLLKPFRIQPFLDAIENVLRRQREECALPESRGRFGNKPTNRPRLRLVE